MSRDFRDDGDPGHMIGAALILSAPLWLFIVFVIRRWWPL